MNRLEGKTALVIGSATGIGREVARLFAAEGAAVALGDRDPAALEGLAPQIGAAFALAVDVTREAEVAAAIVQAITRFGQLDILVNNAGVGGGKSPLHEQSAEVWQRVLDVNLWGVAYGMKHAIPHMKARRSGRIINTASQLAHKPSPLNAMYCASKAAVVALTASVAQEVAADGITVNAVCPGPTDTPNVAQLGPRMEPPQAREPADEAGRAAGRDRLGLRLPRLRRGELLHGSEPVAQRRRRHVVITGLRARWPDGRVQRPSDCGGGSTPAAGSAPASEYTVQSGLRSATSSNRQASVFMIR